MEGITRVLFSCTGIGVVNRGIESFFEEAFGGLKNSINMDIRLLTGATTKELKEKKISFVSRTNKTAKLVSQMTGRTPYAVEQWSSFPSVIKEIKSFRPHVIYSSEANLFFLLHRFRSVIGVPYKLLFSNGGPIGPPFNRMDFVHQVAPFYKEEAIYAGEPEHKHIMVPYGIHVPTEDFKITSEEKSSLRRGLNLPEDRKIVISVGWISAEHKRMDYTIKEIAAIPPGRRPYLLLLGNIDQASNEIIALAHQQLRSEDYSIRSVPYKQVADFYRASDIFVLSSLKEGFGRVFLEALIYNLPVIAHHHPVMKYVIEDQGVLIDLEKPGNLTKAIDALVQVSNPYKDSRDYVRKKFDWQVLSSAYKMMFQRVANTTNMQLY